ncbi:FAD binding domain-containing protein [Piscinibacter koreensis]|uniref:Xanthine dehydrogenase family protein subunit M n=1 Tax=Piscinibacter koreensis TaxID=2742824 RepID=A0A7Y6NMP7_9BURK|nr:xanthine dehydrogenase family protein subunit M [Schlegelella koreensis]NUZ05887.1 xanthine dehydrogenase family protein subunit M [Schlegelella koreensis]
MNRFEFHRASDVAGATRLGAGGARFLAGGTNLVDLMKEDVERPRTVVDITRLPLRGIDDLPDGGLRLGALASNAATACDERVATRYPMLASAILAGASPQLRNAATNGGNINQRTRCYYFYDVATPCNKREPGTGCSAIGGVTRQHAILGASEHCIATHPSDMAVALAALGATVQVTGPAGERSIAFADYHRLPGDEPWRDNTLETGELVTAIDLPAEGFAPHSTYLKLRDRLSYAFALVSVAAALRLDDAGRIAEARVALGGIAHRPWRDTRAEASLQGTLPGDDAFAAFATALLAGARGQGGNDFKIELARRAVRRALRQAADGTPQSQVDKRVAAPARSAA